MMKSIVEYLEATAARVPDKTAFYSDKSSMTFSGLLDMSRRAATAAAGKAKQGSVVALMLDSRSIDNLPAIFGVLYAGCAYAPLDVTMPPERLKLILELMQPAAIIADEKGEKAAEAAGYNEYLKYADAVRHDVDAKLLDDIRAAANDSDAASILYTSGSTGIPKGSIQTHSSYINWTQATIAVYGFDSDVLFGNQSPFFYANSIIDIFPPVALGATVYMLPGGVLTFPKKMIDCLNANKVTELTMTPSSFVAVADSGVLTEGCVPSLKYGIMSGEAMPVQQLRTWMNATPDGEWWHFYGSTEMFSVAVGRVETLPEPGKKIPSGRVFSAVDILLLDESGIQVARGETGEIYVSSPWVSKGYYRDSERTAAAWVTDPAGKGSGRVYYKSGDCAFLNEKDELVVTGRMDSQIKHMGYRMELGEVEAAARASEGVNDCCVLYDRENDKIWCFYTGTPDEKQLRKQLGAVLSKYMIPDQLRRLDEMPHTASFKVDRVTLKGMMKYDK